MSNAEFVALIEKQHLKECEDSDYVMLQDLLQTRHSVDESEDAYQVVVEQQPKRMLRRETAVEMPVTPSKSNLASLMDNEDATQPEKQENQSFRRNLSADRQLSTSPQNVMYLLNPSVSLGAPTSSDQARKLFKKSCESLQKNSSTDTEYSMQPYRVIKQSSNDTNTSLNSSFNIDNSSSFNADLSLDAEASQNITVIENDPDIIIKEASLDNIVVPPISYLKLSRVTNLKKQFSIDQIPKKSVEPKLVQQSNIQLPTTLAKDSSSSTEEHSKEDNKIIPSISTDLVQDEIAKLSSNIKSSTEEETDLPINETMC